MALPSIVLIGPGAIGLALAGALIDNGHNPTLVARTRFEQLRVGWPDGSLDMAAECVTDPGDLSPADVVIVATKATQNASIVEHLQACVGPETIVVVAQNGVDHLERFAGVIHPDAHVLPSVVMLPSGRKAPGHAIVGSAGRLTVPAGPAAEVVKPLFTGSFVEMVTTDDWLTHAWRKLVMNAGPGGVSVLARSGPQIYQDAEAQQLILGLMHEVVEVGRAEGANLSDELPTQLMDFLTSSTTGHITSIVVDRIAGRPTEWRERNQIVVETASKHDIAVPLNQLVATLIRLGEPTAEAPS